MVEHMLTTIDNPFNPFIEFNEWYAFDQASGYNTLGLLARIVNTSDEISEADQSVDIENAIDEIIEMNVDGIYRKVESPVSSGTS